MTGFCLVQKCFKLHVLIFNNVQSFGITEQKLNRFLCWTWLNIFFFFRRFFKVEFPHVPLFFGIYKLTAFTS